MPVSQEMRKENSYWVRRRDEWRRKYQDVVREINYCKSEITYLHRDGLSHRAKRYVVQLRALQNMANTMMIERSHIRLQLRLTSYRYE
jgi:hypothetical protein